jgi:hypothetical protein
VSLSSPSTNPNRSPTAPSNSMTSPPTTNNQWLTIHDPLDRVSYRIAPCPTPIPQPNCTIALMLRRRLRVSQKNKHPEATRSSPMRNHMATRVPPNHSLSHLVSTSTNGCWRWQSNLPLRSPPSPLSPPIPLPLPRKKHCH